MANKKYPVQWKLCHDGKEYSEGDSVALSKKNAEPLLACGVIAEPESAAVEIVVKPPEDDILAGEFADILDTTKDPKA